MYNFTFLNHIIFWFEVLEVNHAQKYLQTARTSFEQGTATSQALQAAPRRSSYRQALAIQQGTQEHKEIGISFFLKKKYFQRTMDKTTKDVGLIYSGKV